MSIEQKFPLPAVLHAILFKRLANAFKNIMVYEEYSFEVHHIPNYDLQCQGINNLADILNSKLNRHLFHAFMDIKTLRKEEINRPHATKCEYTTSINSTRKSVLKYQPNHQIFTTPNETRTKMNTEQDEESYCCRKLLNKIQGINHHFSSKNGLHWEGKTSQVSEKVRRKRMMILEKIEKLEQKLQDLGVSGPVQMVPNPHTRTISI